MSERRLRVLQVGKYYPPHKGGIETHFQALCSGLQSEVDLRAVVSSDTRSTIRERPDGFDLVRLGTIFHISTAPVSPGLRKEIADFQPDIVHIHLPGPNALIAYLLSSHKGALVLSHHSDIVRQRLLGAALAPVMQAGLRRASAILVATRQHIETSDVLPRHARKCRVVPYGIDVEHFAAPQPGSSLIRERFGSPLVLAVGRLVYYKGFQHLIRAMAGVDARLLIIGSGPLQRELEAEAAAAGVADRVFLLAEVEDVRPYYQAADLFVLPSTARSEAFGIVQLEAMASSLPVINTRLDSGAPYVSLHGVSGLTVPPGDPAALREAIQTLLGDTELRARFGANGLSRVREEFSHAGMIRHTTAVYGEIVTNRYTP